MTSIQGLASTTAHVNAPSTAQTAVKPPAPKLEVGETALQERQEAISGTQEIGEGASGNPGSRFSATV